MRDDGATFTAHMQRAARLPRQNQNLRYLLIARVVILLSYVAAPFYSIYSINVLGAPVSIIGVYMGVRTIVALLINPVWSRLSDRRGNKIVMQLAVAVGVIMMAWVVFMPGLARSLNVSADVSAYALVPVFALMGAYETGVGIGAVNLTLEVAPPNDRAIYIGLTNTILGIAYLSTAVSGLIVDLVGYEGVFVLGLILLLVASWALWRLRDPRELSMKGKRMPDEKPLALIRGGGDLGTGVALRLHRAGWRVMITELAQPLVIRRTVAFASAIYDGSIEVEGTVGRRVSPDQLAASWASDRDSGDRRSRSNPRSPAATRSP